MIDSTTAQAMTIPEGRIKVIIQFNKISGAATMVLPWLEPSTLGAQDLFTYVEDQMDLNEDEIVGVYPNYQIVAKADLPEKIYEANMDLSAQSKITKAYPVIEQVNVLGRAVMMLSLAAGIDQAELKEMMDYIEEVKQANKIRKEFYAESPDYEYISNTELAARQAARLEGGVHELYGTEPVTGGRVF